MIDTIVYEGKDLLVLDQNQLPDNIVYQRCTELEEVAEAIRTLKVRGAPLIGVCAAYGMAMAIDRYRGPTEGLDEYVKQVKKQLASTRPTAVNLFWALDKMEQVFINNRDNEPDRIAGEMLAVARSMHEQDVDINRSIGEIGQELIAPVARIMTICNAGALATCGYGTALGVVRSAHRHGKLQMVWACETRPVLQGARLTVWELMQDNIPVTLIIDNMAGYAMSLGRVDTVIVGADRIAANGDTANKIGTYSLAVLANYHSIPFYVAAPLSSIDINLSSGGQIPIELRHDDEIRYIRGTCLSVPEVPVFNPAFDVTPHHLIKAIITEKGIIKPPYNESLPAMLGEEGR
ncbi:MAG: S-methyl-5-thioribose-1-phosphate isomerase [Syntrophomonadaceae bacterium]